MLVVRRPKESVLMSAVAPTAIAVVIVILSVVLFVVIKSHKSRPSPSPPPPPPSPLKVCSDKITGKCTKPNLEKLLQVKTWQSAALPQCSVSDFPNPQVCDSFTQYWINFSSDKAAPRYASVAIPSQKTQPKEGWPVVVYFDFMLGDGHYSPSDRGGLQEQWQTDPNKMNTSDVIFSILQNLVNLGIAVICTSNHLSDTYYYVPDGLGYSFTCDALHEENGCYNHGDNPDSEYFSKIFELIRAASNPALPPSTEFCYDKVALLGYSVGAQTISNLLQQWPQLKTSSGKSYPDLKAAVLIAGGSMYCYAYPSELTEPYSQFMPCKDIVHLGCCPSNITEPRFDSGSDNPPPILLVQQTQDVYADPLATTKYYNTRQASKGDSTSTCLLLQEGQGHGPGLCQQDAILQFITHFLHL